MKTISKLSMIHVALMISFVWLNMLSGTWALAFPQDETTQAIEASSVIRNKPHPPNDSLAKIACDKKPPYFILIDPIPGMTNVARDSAIKFFVLDDFTPKKDEWDIFGLDTDRIFVAIQSRFFNEKDLIPKTTLVEDVYKIYCEYKPPQSFDWSDVVTCSLYAWDRSYLRNFADTVFTFTTIRDTIAPKIEVIRPKPYAAGVDTLTDIVLYVTDVWAGVDRSTVEFVVDQQVIPHCLLEFIHDGVGDTIKYQPSTPFRSDYQVTVGFKVADFAKNWADTNYWFRTDTIPIPPPDTIKPVIEVLRPKPYAAGVDTLTDIVLYVTDVWAGVDRSTVEFVVDQQVIPHSLLEFIHDGVGDTVKYQPPTPLPSDYQVTVGFKVADFAKNWADTNYWFRTDTIPIPPPDTIKPVIEVLRPKPYAAGVDTLTDIVLYVTDVWAGVDRSTVEFVVDQQVIPHCLLEFIHDGVGDTIKYQPSTPFRSDYQVTVGFKVADFAKNWADTSYWFKTVPAHSSKNKADLWILNFTIPKDTFMVGEPICATAYIICSFADCPDTFDVCFYVDEKKDTTGTRWIPGLSMGEIETVTFRKKFDQPGSYTLLAYVNRERKAAEGDTTNNWSKELPIFVKQDGKPELIVRSNPFTPNNDGFNDKVKFDYEQFDVTDPNLKIFDIHGKRIRESGDMEKQGKAFLWDGLDETGRQVLPGAYLYIFSAKSKALARGCVVVAR